MCPAPNHGTLGAVIGGMSRPSRRPRCSHNRILSSDFHSSEYPPPHCDRRGLGQAGHRRRTRGYSKSAGAGWAWTSRPYLTMLPRISEVVPLGEAAQTTRTTSSRQARVFRGRKETKSSETLPRGTQLCHDPVHGVPDCLGRARSVRFQHARRLRLS